MQIILLQCELLMNICRKVRNKMAQGEKLLDS